MDGFTGKIPPAGKRRIKTKSLGSVDSNIDTNSSKVEIKKPIQIAPSTSIDAFINRTAEPVQIVEQVLRAIVQQHRAGGRQCPSRSVSVPPLGQSLLTHLTVAGG